MVLTRRCHAPLQRGGVREPGGSQRVAPVARVRHHTQERAQAAWRRRRAAKQGGRGILTSVRAQRGTEPGEHSMSRRRRAACVASVGASYEMHSCSMLVQRRPQHF